MNTAMTPRSALLAANKTPARFKLDALAHHSHQPDSSSGICELVLTERSPDMSLLLLPMLGYISRSASRWITWIGEGLPDRATLQQYGVDVKKLRVLTIKQAEDNRWILWEALQSGTSHTVIAVNQALTEHELSILEQAAQSSGSQALLIKSR